MTERENITIVCVPPHLFAAAWQLCGDVVREAVRTAGNLGDVVQRVEDADLQLWLVCDGRTALAACFTDINVEDDGSRWLGAYGLHGHGFQQWGKALSERLTAFARAEGCARMMWRSRPFWRRYVPDAKPRQRIGREYVWERVV